MNNSGLEKLFTRCKSLGYPNSKEGFEKDFQQFVASELDSSQLENISGGSAKNKLCASALSALSVLGATSSTGAVNSTKVGNYAGKSPGCSWFSKHKEVVITGAVSFGLASLVASPFIYKQATRSIKYKKVKDYVKKRIPLYFSYLCAKMRKKIKDKEVFSEYNINIIDYTINIDNIDQELRKWLDILSDGEFKDINAKVMKFNDQVKRFIYIISAFGFLVDKYINYMIFTKLKEMIYYSAYSANYIFYMDNYYGDIYLELMIYFCSEDLCGKTPKMLLPSNEECTELEWVDFSIEFLKPDYEGDYSKKLKWLDSIASDVEKQENSKRTVYEKLGIEF